MNILARTTEFLRQRRKHANNLASYFTGRIIAVGIFGISLPFFVKHRGDAAYGTLALLLTLFTYLNVFDFGISYTLGLRYTKALARRNPKAKEIVGHAMPVIGGATLLTVTALIVEASELSHALFGTKAHAGDVRILGVAIGLLLFSSLFNAITQAHGRVDLVNYSKLLGDISKGAGLFAGGLFIGGIRAVMWTILWGVVVRLAFDVYVVHRLMGTLRPLVPRWNWREVALNLRLGVPMAIAMFIHLLLTTLDRVFVSRTMGQTALARYSLAADLVSKAYFLVWAVTGTLYPVIVRYSASRRDPLILLKVSLAAVVLVAFFIYLPLAAFAKMLITWWMGPAWGRNAAGIVAVWCGVAVAYLLMTTLYSYLQGRGRPVLLLLLHVATLAAMLGGLFAMPRHFGVVGIAVVMGGVFSLEAVAMGILAHAKSGLRSGAISLVIEAIE